MNLFRDYQEFESESYVTVADKNHVKVVGKGNINVKVLVADKMFDICIYDVLYVPGICTNLLSVSQMVSKNNVVEFKENMCRIYNSNNILVATGTLIDKMYELNTVVSHQSCVAIDKHIWHRRLGHTNLKNVERLKSQMKIDYVDTVDKPCLSCFDGKQTRLQFKPSKSKRTSILELIHGDVCGPFESQSIGGAKYYVSFLDDYSKKVFIFPIKWKSEVIDKFEYFKNVVENQSNKKIKVFRSDNGKEFCNTQMSKLCAKSGIIHQKTAPYCPEQNGKKERMNRTIVEKIRCLLSDAGLNKSFWAEAANTAVFLINRTPCDSLAGKCPEEVWSQSKIDLSNLRVFGCLAMVHVPKQKRLKLDSKSIKCIMVGFCENSKAYRLINPENNKLIISRDVVFLEDQSWSEVNISLNIYQIYQIYIRFSGKF